jgi:biopolymer transport protein ExbB
MMEFIDVFNEGGPFMYAILILALFALGIIINRSYAFYHKYRISEDEVAAQVMKSVEANNYARAIQVCNAKAHPMTTILKAGLMRANRSEKEIRRSMEIAATEEIAGLKKGISVLPHLSNVSTLLGLLGTIRGLIIAFSGMESGDAVQRQEALSKGIALAFRATFFALAVAVVMILFYVILTSKQNKILTKIERAGTSLVDILTEKNKVAAGALKPAK